MAWLSHLPTAGVQHPGWSCLLMFALFSAGLEYLMAYIGALNIQVGGQD